MKTTNILKNGALSAFVLTVAIGCSSTQQQQEEPAKPAAKKDTTCQAELAAAEAARKKAASVGGEWRDTGKIIKKAKAALKAGNGAKCVKLANKARKEGEMGYAQAISQRVTETGAPASDSYNVQRGDNLWNISGKGSIYGDPYQWPLIYKANRSQISDADLIYPGQDLSIDRAASSTDVAAAVSHARTRGAWAIGVVEESDKAYLAK